MRRGGFLQRTPLQAPAGTCRHLPGRPLVLAATAAVPACGGASLWGGGRWPAAARGRRCGAVRVVWKVLLRACTNGRWWWGAGSTSWQWPVWLHPPGMEPSYPPPATAPSQTMMAESKASAGGGGERPRHQPTDAVAAAATGAVDGPVSDAGQAGPSPPPRLPDSGDAPSAGGPPPPAESRLAPAGVSDGSHHPQDPVAAGDAVRVVAAPAVARPDAPAPGGDPMAPGAGGGDARWPRRKRSAELRGPPASGGSTADRGGGAAGGGWAVC